MNSVFFLSIKSMDCISLIDIVTVKVILEQHLTGDLSNEDVWLLKLCSKKLFTYVETKGKMIVGDMCSYAAATNKPNILVWYYVDIKNDMVIEFIAELFIKALSFKSYDILTYICDGILKERKNIICTSNNFETNDRLILTLIECNGMVKDQII